ncbi:MAG: hypothetical protein INR65_06550 [Gluconacetobacter diazotrophicus]|nr:hypothetical protein [Gluconacetobacter diazotrophicus]
MNSSALTSKLAAICAAGALLMVVAAADGQDPYASSTDFAKYAERLRNNAVLQMQPQTVVPVNPYPVPGTNMPPGVPFNPAVPYQWKKDIVTTVFWVGEPAGTNNPVNNVSSSWDHDWAVNFGGMDDPNPANRRNFLPVRFTPRLNPFYIALPYNDVTKGSTKPESRLVIPWYQNAFVEEGRSVCRDRWIAIHNPRNGRVCYAQWSDCGPFRTDHWQYVFGNDRPRPNLNQGAGLDVSPAVRDYLELNGLETTDWRFVEFHEVPRGPWSLYGANNTFVQQGHGESDRVAAATASVPLNAGAGAAVQQAANAGPQVTVH